MTELAAIIEELIKREGLTRPAFAKKIGVGTSTLYMIAYGQRGIGPEIASKLIAHYPELKDRLAAHFLGRVA